MEVRRSRYHDALDNHSPYTPSVGSGRAVVLRDGRAFDAVWQRTTAAQGTRFMSPDGSPLTFARGQIWVMLAPA
ncbi:DUF3048 C-terminal domain-containing protein [Streptomyces echinoruber]|uniref:DUF3048 domain-containing protein n=1 Tax=Streptomyces echinoruber TaxID=68898 RepID=A0A918RRN2_9ACTN|nr:DUF3048 C-terminal domain-containing protein [Streptomyces echinoruber]GHA06667.1 hypothetical protein GCM10010389_52520 [Streptomyces echinoruber]